MSPHVQVGYLLMGKFVSFLLIFRANGAYVRYWGSSTTIKEVETSSRELHMMYLVYIRGGLDYDEQPKSEEARRELQAKGTRIKTDATRLILAFLVSFKMHTRLAWEGYLRGSVTREVVEQVSIDRARLRGLLTADEFEALDKLTLVSEIKIPVEKNIFRKYCCKRNHFKVNTETRCRMCDAILYLLICLNLHASSPQNKAWGWIERTLNLADSRCKFMRHGFESMDQNISIPLPLPYQHLCKWMMFSFLLGFPLIMETYSDGLMINIIAMAAISVAMFGIETIGMEIEDPFGDDANDLNTMRMIEQVETAMFEMMLCRGEAALQNFAWVKAPDEYLDCARFLCLVSERQRVLSMIAGSTIIPYQSLAFPDMHIDAPAPSRSLSPQVKEKSASAWGALPMRPGGIDPRVWRYYCKAPAHFSCHRFFDWLLDGLRCKTFPAKTLQDLKERFPSDWEGVPRMQYNLTPDLETKQVASQQASHAHDRHLSERLMDDAIKSPSKKVVKSPERGQASSPSKPINPLHNLPSQRRSPQKGTWQPADVNDRATQSFAAALPMQSNKRKSEETHKASPQKERGTSHEERSPSPSVGRLQLSSPRAREVLAKTQRPRKDEAAGRRPLASPVMSVIKDFVDNLPIGSDSEGQ